MFTPIETSIGAVLLHQATSNLLFQNGTVLGLSGLLRRVMNAPTMETLALFAGMAASFPLLNSLLPELVTMYPSMPITVSTTLFTTGVAALVGLGTKVRGFSTTDCSKELIDSSSRMVAHPDTCSAVFHA